MSKIRDRMIIDLALAEYSEGTQEVYLSYAKKFVKHFMRSPEEMGAEEVRQYLFYLSNVRKLASSTIRIACAAIRFLYAVTLNRPVEVKWIPVPRRKIRLPVVLSGTEVATLLDAVQCPKYHAIISAMYAGGLRISEACSLKVEDIDTKRMVLRITGKGDNERLTLLSHRLLKELRTYWRDHRPGRDDTFLFPGSKPGNFISTGSARVVFRKAAVDAGIRRGVTPHSLRHSFATHLIEMGVGITIVKALLGHKSLKTTERYVHVSTEKIIQTTSPLDLLGTDEARVIR